MGLFEFPEGVSAILSTLAITLVPEYDLVISRGAEALRTGGRFAVLDLADRHPWESINKYLSSVIYHEYYYGVLYLSVGQHSE